MSKGDSSDFKFATWNIGWELSGSECEPPYIPSRKANAALQEYNARGSNQAVKRIRSSLQEMMNAHIDAIFIQEQPEKTFEPGGWAANLNDNYSSFGDSSSGYAVTRAEKSKRLLSPSELNRPRDCALVLYNRMKWQLVQEWSDALSTRIYTAAVLQNTTDENECILVISAWANHRTPNSAMIPAFNEKIALRFENVCSLELRNRIKLVVMGGDFNRPVDQVSTPWKVAGLPLQVPAEAHGQMTHVGYHYPLKKPHALGSAAGKLLAYFSGVGCFPAFEKGSASSDVIMYGCNMGQPTVKYTVEPWESSARRRELTIPWGVDWKDVLRRELQNNCITSQKDIYSFIDDCSRQLKVNFFEGAPSFDAEPDQSSFPLKIITQDGPTSDHLWVQMHLSFTSQ